jgi:hypothetical protein
MPDAYVTGDCSKACLSFQACWCKGNTGAVTVQGSPTQAVHAKSNTAAAVAGYARTTTASATEH